MSDNGGEKRVAANYSLVTSPANGAAMAGVNGSIMAAMSEADQAAMLRMWAARTGGSAVDMPPTAEPAGLHVPQPLKVAELLTKKIDPLEYLVDGLLARGHLAVLGGRPKSGKTWLGLQMAQAVDTGAQFIGRVTKRARVLYVALEDGERRVFQRAQLLRWKPEEAAVLFDIAKFDGGNGPGPGVEQLARLAADFDLIIVDTLIATLSGRANENDNAAMGSIVNEIARIAHGTNTAIVLVHHTGKGVAESAFDLLRGASAIRGAYDVGLVLQRKQDEREAILHGESRDVDLESLTLRQAENGEGWECLGNGGELKRIRAGRAAVETLAEHGGGVTSEELAELAGKSRQTVHQQLVLAERDGLVVRRGTRDSGKGGRPADIWHLAGAS